MARLTFLRAMGDRPMVKQFTDAGTRSYPRIKRVTSTSYDNIDTLPQFEELLRLHATNGDCLLKGHPDTPLNEESRKGRVDRDMPTGFIALDFDNVTVDDPIRDLRQAAEFLINRLPTEFQNTSYIAQASASFRRKRESLSLHLFFLLKTPVHPRALKEYITSLNFDEGYFQDRIALSATGTALSYPVDRTIADNSRIIYIAPPVFSGEQTDPFEDPADRIIRVDKPKPLLNLEEPLAEINPERLASKSKAKIKALRAARGLKGRTERTRTMVVDGVQVAVVTNPDRVHMVIAEDEDSYVRYNVNSGDSNAYWVHKHNPVVVYNFKGEPNFLFEAADPESFAAHVQKWGINEVVTEEGLRPLMFLDYSTAKYYYGLYDPQVDRMDSVYQCSFSDIKHFTAQHGVMMPETVPVWRYEFQPQNETVIDFEQQFLNRYEAPEHLRNPVAIPDEFRGVKLGYGHTIEQLCPTIWKLLFSVCGSGVIETEHFLNWLAFIVKTRSKAMTAWVFHGVPGTGKGLLYNNVLAPLLGEQYAMMKRAQDLEEKFNQWMRQSLLFVVDEFRLDNGIRSKQSDMLNKIKNLITEQKGTIRAMGTDQVETKLYANVIFFSNDHDAIRIQDGDRRFNVAPRQEVALIKSHPELLQNNVVVGLCRDELPLFASFLLAYEVDEMAVILPLENTAKAVMREASADSADLFVEAVMRGDLDYFVPILDEPYRMSGEDYTLAAKNLVKAFIRDCSDNPDDAMVVFTSELRPLYNVLCGRAENEHKFGKLLSRHGLQTELIRRGKTVKRGVRIRWTLVHNKLEELRELHLNALDNSYADAPMPTTRVLEAVH